jgi:hypothetical protein
VAFVCGRPVFSACFWFSKVCCVPAYRPTMFHCVRASRAAWSSVMTRPTFRSPMAYAVLNSAYASRSSLAWGGGVDARRRARPPVADLVLVLLWLRLRLRLLLLVRSASLRLRLALLRLRLWLRLRLRLRLPLEGFLALLLADCMMDGWAIKLQYS